MSSRGGKRLDDRRILNGIVWKFRTGTAWRDVPERSDPWATLHTRFRRCAADGTFDRMPQAAQAKADAAGGIEWLVSVDSTVVRAHQHAAGAEKGLRDPAFGRSRGGPAGNVRLASDNRLPILCAIMPCGSRANRIPSAATAWAAARERSTAGDGSVCRRATWLPTFLPLRTWRWTGGEIPMVPVHSLVRSKGASGVARTRTWSGH
ncbi:MULTISPECIES: transposase [unclassified Streptomyces]